MTYSAKILCDSVSSAYNFRLTTFEVCMPRIVLAEWNTHRWFSRNSASSRAIPVKKMIERVMTEPYIPSTWGQNQKGMQAGEEVPLELRAASEKEWLLARDDAVRHAERLLEHGIHKQITNRLLEPFMWHVCIVSATEWSNFENLRDNPAAHPDIQKPARMIRELRAASEPTRVAPHEWHLPFWGDKTAEPLPMYDAVRAVIGRCARVSYLTHDGRADLQEDIGLFERLIEPGHMSPLEHAARVMDYDELQMFAQKEYRYNRAENSIGGYWEPTGRTRHFLGNFEGWVQFRKLVPGEEDILAFRREEWR
jgi:thymidylate synthase ThyX